MDVPESIAVSRRRSGWTLLLLLALSACGKNTAPLERSSQTSPEPGGAAAGVAASPHGAWAGGEGGAMPMNAWTVSGTIDLAPELAGKTGGSDVLYVMARVPGERMPLSVERYPAPAFPLAYRLRSGHGAGAADAPPAMEILARLSRAGTAGPPQPGDLEGTYDGTAAAGATGVDFVIDIEH